VEAAREHYVSHEIAFPSLVPQTRTPHLPKTDAARDIGNPAQAGLEA
jgi:hypothetical protein